MSKKEKKLALVTLLTVIVVLLGVFAIRFIFFHNEYGNIRPVVVNPTSEENSSEESTLQAQTNDTDIHTSFIPLLPTETLMDTLTIDFDGDTLDDQIIAIRKANSPNLFLIVGLYNPNTNSYERSAEISTAGSPSADIDKALKGHSETQSPKPMQPKEHFLVPFITS